jgi:hypothetical protein
MTADQQPPQAPSAQTITTHGLVWVSAADARDNQGEQHEDRVPRRQS